MFTKEGNRWSSTRRLFHSSTSLLQPPLPRTTPKYGANSSFSLLDWIVKAGTGWSRQLCRWPNARIPGTASSTGASMDERGMGEMADTASQCKLHLFHTCVQHWCTHKRGGICMRMLCLSSCLFSLPSPPWWYCWPSTFDSKLKTVETQFPINFRNKGEIKKTTKYHVHLIYPLKKF